MSETAVVAPDVTPAASSPAPTSASAFDTMTDAQRSEWLQTGKIPGQSAESAPASPDGQAASTDAKSTPASETGKPENKRGIDARLEQLEAKKLRLQKELAEAKALELEWEATQKRLQERGKPSESRPESKQDTEPQEADFESYADYVKALGQYAAREALRQEQQSARAREAQAKHQSVLAETAKAAEARIQAKMAADPTFIDKVNPDLLQVVPVSALPPNAPIQPHNVLADEVMRSEHVADLLTHFSEHPEDWTRICQTGSPAAMMREFVKLEAQFSGEAPASAFTPTISQAPNPPKTLGKKPTADNADPVMSALAKKDFRAYQEAANRAEIARRRGR